MAGFDAVMVENYLDVPFYPERVPAETVAALTVCVREVVQQIGLCVGVNVLRNDGESAVAVAAPAMPLPGLLDGPSPLPNGSGVKRFKF